MNKSASIPLLFLPVALFASGCDDDACTPEGGCFRSGFQCDYQDDKCKPPCATDDECGAGSYCVAGRGLCRTIPDGGWSVDSGDPVDVGSGDTSPPDSGEPDLGPPDSGMTDTGVPPCTGGVGAEGCACYGNGTCDFGSACSSAHAVCLDATGEADQPCFDNGTCSPGLDCVGPARGTRVCRLAGTGTVTGACFDTTLASTAQACRSPTAICERGICLGGPGDACSDSLECATGYACDRGQCRSAPLCRSALDCSRGQLCCGEPGTPFASAADCPAAIRLGDCFDAPASTYAQSCTSHEDCSPAPAMSPESTGISLCMDWGEPICSAPCNPDAPASGCPNRWQCEPSYLTCMTDQDCGAPGLTCVGASPALERVGRCQCGTSTNDLVGCTSPTSSTAASLPTSTCTPEPRSSGFYCVVDAHCVPPSD